MFIESPSVAKFDDIASGCARVSRIDHAILVSQISKPPTTQTSIDLNFYNEVNYTPATIHREVPMTGT